MKKLLCVLLAALTLLSFAACGNTSDDSTNTTEAQAVVSSEEAVVTTKEFDDALPDKMDFGGEEIRVLSADRNWWCDEVTPSEDDGTLLNNAVFERNAKVEDRLNIKIKNEKLVTDGNTMISNAISTNYKNGTKLYDISYCNAYRAAIVLPECVFLDLNKVENLDLTKEYWLQSLNEQMSYKGSQYMASGDIANSTVRMAFATLFNKNMFEDNKVELLYDTVDKKAWTLEYQLSILETFYKPKTVGETSDEDIYGLVSSDRIVSDGFWEACDLSILRKNSDGEYYYSTDGDRYSNVVQGLIDIFKSKGTKKFAHIAADGEFPLISEFFAKGQAAMATVILTEVEREWVRTMKDSYGVVPLPMLNKDQSDYHTHLFDQYTVVSILRGVDTDKLAMYGAFLQAMASASAQITMPAFYEVTLKQKYQSDPKSWEMLDLIMSHVVCDAGNLYYSVINSPHAELGQIVESGTNTVSSKMAGYQKIMSKVIPVLNKNLDKVIATPNS